jgi:hypothetical protein
MRDRRPSRSKQQRDGLALPRKISLGPPGVVVQRCYKQQATVLDDLAEVLEILLLDDAESHGSFPSADPHRLAFQANPSEECV